MQGESFISCHLFQSRFFFNLLFIVLPQSLDLARLGSHSNLQMRVDTSRNAYADIYIMHTFIVYSDVYITYTLARRSLCVLIFYWITLHTTLEKQQIKEKNYTKVWNIMTEKQLVSFEKIQMFGYTLYY